MLWMISKFIFCLLAAGVLGFIAGWILSSLIKNEQSEEKYLKLKDDFDTKRAELNQAYSDLDKQDYDIKLLNNNMDQTRKELLMKNMDLEEYEKNGFISPKANDLELENNTLKEEISEYKYLENENELLHNDINVLSMEKEKLLANIEEKKILLSQKAEKEAATLDKSHVAILEKDLKRAKNKIKHMQSVLKNIDKEVSKPLKRKKRRQEEEIKIFDFQKEPTSKKKKKSQNK